jgi:hypothetical protein
VVRLFVLLSLEPVGSRGGTGSLGRSVLALDLNGHALILLQVAGKVGLLGRRGGLGDAEGLDVALGIGLLDGGDLVGLELLEVKLLDEVGCKRYDVSNCRLIKSSHILTIRSVRRRLVRGYEER